MENNPTEKPMENFLGLIGGITIELSIHFPPLHIAFAQ